MLPASLRKPTKPGAAPGDRPKDSRSTRTLGVTSNLESGLFQIGGDLFLRLLGADRLLLLISDHLVDGSCISRLALSLASLARLRPIAAAFANLQAR